MTCTTMTRCAACAMRWTAAMRRSSGSPNSAASRWTRPKSRILKKEDEAGFLPCSNALLDAMLDGLIIERRGRIEPKPDQPPPAPIPFGNNGMVEKAAHRVRAARGRYPCDQRNSCRFPCLENRKSARCSAKKATRTIAHAATSSCATSSRDPRCACAQQSNNSLILLMF